MRKIFDIKLVGPAVALAIVSLVVALTTRRFLDPGNLANLSLHCKVWLFTTLARGGDSSDTGRSDRGC